MFSLLGKHPILSAMVLTLVYPITIFLLWLLLDKTGVFGEDVFFGIWFPVGSGVPLVVNLLVTLARRRGGGSTLRLWVLLAIGPAYCVLLLVTIGAYRKVIFGGNSVGSVLRWVGNVAEDGQVQVAFVLSVIGAVVGLLAGLGIARWLIRNGRWETIVPVGKVR